MEHGVRSLTSLHLQVSFNLQGIGKTGLPMAIVSQRNYH